MEKDLSYLKGKSTDYLLGYIDAMTAIRDMALTASSIADEEFDINLNALKGEAHARD